MNDSWSMVKIDLTSVANRSIVVGRPVLDRSTTPLLKGATMTTETPMALLKEYFDHQGNDFECGTVYISREYADRDADIRRRIASMIAKMEADRTSER
tara:strand:- start:1515 stop:1808 length:294 start_codon:yes stop_codon:yes gene_type:complete